MTLYLGTNKIAGESYRNIGEIIQSTIPLTDAGLHLLDGGVIQRGSYTAFVDYISSLVSSYPDLFTTESNWQQSVNDYGVCGKFVYDSTNNTVRLPKITGFTEGTIDPTVLGNLTEAGLPNITGSFTNENTAEVGDTGAFYKDSASRRNGRSGNDNYNDWNYFDASRSNPIYGNSDTVQPQAIKVLYYICIATSTKTNIQVDIDEIASDLNNKVDKNDLTTVHCVIETYVNGTSWYRVWSDDWCEQGGIKSETSQTSITLLKQFSDTNYMVTGAITDSTSATGDNSIVIGNITSSGFTIYSVSKTRWYACGYI